MNHFVTSADRSYLLRTLCLFDSFVGRRSTGRFWFFARDDQTADILQRLGSADLTRIEAAEYETAALRAVRSQRSPLEYACTAKPIFLQHVMDRAADGDWVTWLDGDMFFFQPAEHVIPATTASVLLTPHRFTPRFAPEQPTVGAYNAGLVAFRKTANGTACLNWWAERCLEWCGAVPEAGRYADQKYLESFARKFAAVGEIDSAGINAAPWNAIERPMHRCGGDIRIERDSLVLFHFQGLRIIHRHLFDLYADDRLRLPAALRTLVYRPYIEALQAAMRRVGAIDPKYRVGSPGGWRQTLLGPIKRFLLRRGNLTLA